MSSKRKPLDITAISSAAVPQPDPVATATAAAPAPVPAPRVAAAPAPKAGKAEKKVWKSQAARVGRASVQGYVPEETRRALKILAVKQGRTLEDLLCEAINDLLAKHKAG